MKRCKTCKLWVECEDCDTPEGYKACRSERMFGNPKNCDMPDHVYIDPDDPYCVPTFCPGPEFGCVHHTGDGR